MTDMNSLLVPRLKYLETNVEGEKDSYRSGGNGGPSSSTYMYLSPRMGVEWKNYVYHPYLLNYSLLFEPGYVWEARTLDSQKSQSGELSLNGSYIANLLESKPYATSVSYSRTHEQVKYDLFNSATVESETFGGATGYRDGPVPVKLSYYQTHEDATDFNQTMLTDQRTLNLDARNDRSKDNFTDFTYQFYQLDRDTQQGGYGFTTANTYNHAGLTDIERFSSSTLQSTFRFDDRESPGNSAIDLNAAANYNILHSDHLRSYYNVSASGFTGDQSDSYQTYAQAGITHQLFDSLSTGLEGHGSTFNSGSAGSTLDSQSAGTTASIDYTKRLSGWSRLSIHNTTGYNFTEQENSGSDMVIPNESHVVPVSGLVRLNQPRAVSLDVVTDIKGTPLQLGLDYTVIETTDPWQIQIITTGPARIQPGDVILVTYTILANPTGHYSTLSDDATIRLSFWDNLTSVYLRYYTVNNNASSSEFLLQDDQVLETGAEFNWHQFHVNGSYVDEHSTLYDNQTYNLAESYSHGVWTDCSVGVDLTQQWGVETYNNSAGTNQTDHLTFYNFMLHYDWHPLSTLNWTAEVGYRMQRGFGFDQDLFAARTYVNWTIAKFQLHFGYEHQLQEIRPNLRESDFVFLRLRRSF